jgi:hypothetical protein
MIGQRARPAHVLDMEQTNTELWTVNGLWNKLALRFKGFTTKKIVILFYVWIKIAFVMCVR